MDKTVKVAVIGLKGVGTNHAKKLAGMKGVQLVAVCDMVKERAEQAAKEFSVPQVFTDYREMLRAEFDVLVSCTGQYARRDHVAAGLEALADHITPRTGWLIAHHMEAGALRDGTLGARARKRLEASEDFDELMLLCDCDRQGRKSGVDVPEVEEALQQIRELARLNGPG